MINELKHIVSILSFAIPIFFPVFTLYFIYNHIDSFEIMWYVPLVYIVDYFLFVYLGVYLYPWKHKKKFNIQFFTPLCIIVFAYLLAISLWTSLINQIEPSMWENTVGALFGFLAFWIIMLISYFIYLFFLY